MNVIKTDVAIIGSCLGGYAAAIRLRQYGKSVLLINNSYHDKDNFDISQIKTFALFTSANTYNDMLLSYKMGIQVSERKFNWQYFLHWINGISNKINISHYEQLERNNVNVINGHAYFKTANNIELTTEKEIVNVAFEHCIIATGSKSIELPDVPINENNIISSEGLYRLKNFPKDITIMGAGLTGLELAFALNKLGSKVSVIEMEKDVLPDLEEELSSTIKEKLKESGINLFLNSIIKGCKTSESNVELIYERENKIHTQTSEIVISSLGRIPDVEGLNMSNIGIETNDDGQIYLNEKLQTNITNIYMVGDSARSPFLVNKSIHEGCSIAEIIVEKEESVELGELPFVAYTDPEIAVVGMSEAAAKKDNINFIAKKLSLSVISKTLVTQHPEGYIKVIADRESGLVLGCQVVGHNISSIIGELTLAIEMGTTVEDLSLICHPHPSISECISEVSNLVQNKAIFTFNR